MIFQSIFSHGSQAICFDVLGVRNVTSFEKGMMVFQADFGSGIE